MHNVETSDSPFQGSEADDALTPELRDNLEVQFNSLRGRIAELEENIDGLLEKHSS